MFASRSKRFFTLALSALFLLSAIPAGASGAVSASAQEFDLQLDKVLSGLGDELSSLDLVDEAVAEADRSREPVRVATLSTTAVNELLRSDQAIAAQKTGSSSGKKASWLKKKWWIPVLGAVVLGAALSDGDGDDTLDDGED